MPESEFLVGIHLVERLQRSNPSTCPEYFRNIFHWEYGLHHSHCYSHCLPQLVRLVNAITSINSMRDIFTTNGADKLMCYMLTLLIVGVLGISYLNSNKLVDNMTIRKLFHILAFALFFPGILYNVMPPDE